MSSLLFLTSDDFTVKKVQGERNILTVGIAGFSFILFYSPQCTFCPTVLNVFKKLPNSLQGCQFGIINVTINKPLIQKSNYTNDPIKFVPLLLLYFNGYPLSQYSGAIDIDSMRSFIIDKSTMVYNAGMHKDSKLKDIPNYTIGVPLCGDGNVCYLEYDEAYT